MALVLLSERDWNQLVQAINGIRSTQAQILQAQNALSAKFDALKGLSPADQGKLNQIFAAATGDSAKIDAALSPAKE